MSDDIVTRLRDYLAIVDHAFVWNELSDAADEIERLRTDRDRWKTVALCHACKPTAGNYCPDHYRMMNAPSPWTSHGNPRSI